MNRLNDDFILVRKHKPLRLARYAQFVAGAGLTKDLKKATRYNQAELPTVVARWLKNDEPMLIVKKTDIKSHQKGRVLRQTIQGLD